LKKALHPSKKRRRYESFSFYRDNRDLVFIQQTHTLKFFFSNTFVFKFLHIVRVKKIKILDRVCLKYFFQGFL